MVLTIHQVRRAERYLQEGEELKKLFPQLATLLDELAVDMGRAIRASEVVDACTLCSAPAFHKKFTVRIPYAVREYPYCCRCFPFVMTGGRQAGGWHPNCLRIYSHLKTNPPNS
jgi:hypothetical protein